MLDNRHHLLPAHARAAAHLAARHVGIGARRRRKPAAVRDAIASAGSLAWS
jgi:hypothetical protein